MYIMYSHLTFFHSQFTQTDIGKIYTTLSYAPSAMNKTSIQTKERRIPFKLTKKKESTITGQPEINKILNQKYIIQKLIGLSTKESVVENSFVNGETA